ncbi:hypothetical protein ACCS95_17605 [Rhizobium ruizarguesonis]|nr:hypothetical protein E0H70_07225 [Rhizobium leguminosarum bv. viciae]
MSGSALSEKDIIEIYEQGKHRRYSLLFAVNGAAFAIGKLLTGDPQNGPVVLGGMTIEILALAMIFFSIVMTFDICKFGIRMKKLDSDLFQWPGKLVLVAFLILLAGGWGIVGFAPPARTACVAILGIDFYDLFLRVIDELETPIVSICI